MTLETTDSLVPVPGGRIFVRHWRESDAQGAPLVLMHDSLGSVEMWRDFPALLAAASHRPVIAYDRLGFGQSTPRTGRASNAFIDEEAEFYFPAVRSALGMKRFSLFGHSVGGAMAIRIAGFLPASCESVVTESAQCFIEQRTLDGIRAAEQSFSDPAQLQKLAKWHGERAHWVLDAWTQIWLSPEFAGWSLEPHLADVTCPVLAIHGDHDEYGSEEFPRRIVNGVNGPSQMIVLQNCGHVPHRERPAQIVHLATTFLEVAATIE